MDALTMWKIAVAVLGLTTLFGLWMAVMRFTGRPNPPDWLPMVHGLLAGSGFTLLLYAGIASRIPQGAWGGFGLLVLAAAGGLVLNLVYQAKKRPLPVSIVLVHAAVAIVGYAVLATAGWK
ncbi:MAG: hypothetical protein ACJ8GO_13670 [Ramlibacter sp.]